MAPITLVVPQPEHQGAATDMKLEFWANGETVINGSALLDQMDYPDWLLNTRSNSHPATVRKDWVLSSTFFAFRQSDGALIGMVDIRHSLDHPFLAQYGGHIGYSVRPSERRKGYATELLRQALLYAKQLGLSSVMLGCYSDNLASQKTILACGGRLAERKPSPDGRMSDVYWIAL